MQKMHVKNMTLLITDPCYIEHGSPFISKSTLYGDWSCFCYKGTKEQVKELIAQWDEMYFKFFHEYNFTGKTEEEKKALYEEFEQKKKEFKEAHTYGEFCADSGMVAVFDYNDLDEGSKEWVKNHPWCACVIENYTGDVEYVIETETDEKGKTHESAHIVGDNFYTSQSGL